MTPPNSLRTRLGMRLHRRRAPQMVLGEGAVLDSSARAYGRVTLGAGSFVEPGAMLLAYDGHITLGADTSVGPYSILYGHGGLTVGDNVLIAAHCVIIPANHRFDRLDVPIRHQGETREGITIGDDVWIAAHVTILDGVTIGDHAVVAAGAVVRDDVAPRAIVGGVPARVLGRRGPSDDTAG